MATLEISGLNKSFAVGQSRREVLRNIDLTLADNEFVSIVGPSGCGKSTLLSIAAGLEEFDSGSVKVDGVPITGPGLDRGVVFQSYTLLPWLTARQNVEFALKAAGMSRAQCREIADEHLELVKLTKFAEAYPNELSGGMKQRVAIARALSYRPKILLMDEPFGALDSQTRMQMQQLLLRVWDHSKKTVVFVTHDIDEAILLGDRVYVMGARPGRIKRILDVPIERPRSLDMVMDRQFIEMKREILGLLHDDLEEAH